MDENVKSSLETLHGQLGEEQVTDDAKKAQLAEVRQAVRDTIDNPAAEHHLTLRERLETVSALFDAEHPKIATALHTAINVLADAGF
jgi:FtsP/CotA-like multicopper oxidase with cupredoxin domain